VIFFLLSKSRSSGPPKEVLPEYKFYAEFQSHEPEFDYLKSLEIEEKINKIRWCKRQNQARFLLTTNDKTVKLWKVFEKNLKSVSSSTVGDQAAKGQLVIPKLSTKQTVVAAAPRRIFANAHAYHINSIALNSDGETFISSDDLRINLWNLGISDQSFNIVDIKPTNMEELTEVITSAEFHPQMGNIFMYSSSKGTIKLCDMRASALCDTEAKVFEEAEDPSQKSFFSEIISSISDVKFGGEGRYIIARDYLTLKLWDMHMESKPVRTIRIHDYLRSKLCDLYENDCIFDKFECAMSGDGNHFITGSYHNYFYLYDREAKGSLCLEASKHLPKTKRANLPKSGKKKGSSKSDEVNPDAIDFDKKVLHASWHPKENLIAIAASNNLFLYSAPAAAAGAPLSASSGGEATEERV
jgi:serine/threonine-protein phosphatase 2A regulatory subunit B